MPAAPAVADRPPAARHRPPSDRPARDRRRPAEPRSAEQSPAPEPFPPPVHPLLQNMPYGRLVLGGATWATYRALRDAPENDRLKMTYDGPAGFLEIEMSEGPLHATTSRLLLQLVLVYLRNAGVRYVPTGSTTLRSEAVGRGAEADESLYVRSLPDAPDLTANDLDLDAGAPPDLVIEIDVTSPGVSKLPAYAALGVPEVWVWEAEGARLTARRLGEDGAYAVVTESGELPGFPLSFAADLLRDRGGRDASQLEAAFAERLSQAPPA